MELRIIFILFTLIFFNSAHAACVPRNNSTSAPNPHAPRNLKPLPPAAPTTLQSCPAPEAAGLVDAVLTALPQATGRYNGPSDIPSVLAIAIQAGLDFAKAAAANADRLSTQSGMPPNQVAALNDCKDSYDDVSYNFQNAYDALPAKDVGTMNTMLSAAITDVGDCMDGFEGMDSPMATFSDKLKMMASNTLAIIVQLK
ncbi:uncharacterized protein LOC141661816 [Apium graveolens]|uniref:uncharacterized protein LOC141661816 n=1 Tax=Apium graveolens TaxID=4045 RepID=UPI003D7AFA47